MRTAFPPRPARVQEIVDGAPGTLGQRGDAFAFARQSHAMRSDVRCGAGAQPQRNPVIALATAFDVSPQQVRAEPAADAG